MIGVLRMDNTAKKNKNGSVKWIIILCLTAVLAIVGWTTTANLSSRMGIMEDIKAQCTANNVRIAVLENRYDTIQATLVEIKMILQKLRDAQE